MKKKHLIFAAILALPLFVSAAEVTDFEKGLALTPEQKTKLDAIFKDQQEKLRAVSMETNAKVKAVLSAEQNQKWESMRQKLLEKKREMIRQHQSKQQ